MAATVKPAVAKALDVALFDASVAVVVLELDCDSVVF